MAATATEIVCPLNPQQLDALAERREQLRKESGRSRSSELEEINRRITEQIQVFGFTPPRASRRKRLLGERWRATLSLGETSANSRVAGRLVLERILGGVHVGKPTRT